VPRILLVLSLMLTDGEKHERQNVVVLPHDYILPHLHRLAQVTLRPHGRP